MVTDNVATEPREAPIAAPEPTGVEDGLTPASLYGGAAKPPEKPDEKAEADTKEKPPKATPKAGTKADAEPDSAQQQRQWDEDRQRRDQDHANERKALVGQVDLMKAQMTALQTQLAEAGKTGADEEAGRKRLAAAGQLEGLMAGLKEEADPAVIAVAVQKMGALIADLIVTPTPGSAIDASQVQEILDRLGQIETGFRDLSAETAAQASEANLEKMLRALDHEFSPGSAKYRNAAVKRARDMLGAEGRTVDSPPTPLETQLALRNAYMAEAAGDKKPGDMPGGKAGVLPGDTGTGGSAAPFAMGPAGTLEEVLADKMRKGEVR